MRHLGKIGVLAALALPALAGCNTVSGVGKDIQAVGRGVSGASASFERALFGTPQPRPPVAKVSYVDARGQVIAGPACDPAAGELKGGGGLPPCPKR
jgi:predicted small secreted protein